MGNSIYIHKHNVIISYFCIHILVQSGFVLQFLNIIVQQVRVKNVLIVLPNDGVYILRIQKPLLSSPHIQESKIKKALILSFLFSFSYRMMIFKKQIKKQQI